ncbi:formylglycine-generating enzyme family protein [Sphingobium sp. D43FB]|uniref:formylglycine-generating enzyme family protein n=1 Tax=Sphingobium sp. D43FB TaxID=2017595 RepID=UPI000BB59F2B|nr:formylglycine-generating enzyme family protein [Sphingobium sp. D43FB]PBN41825.1 hypothetical protein SxD43FB_19590 [Sphingobium sp. D43FB]
MIRLVVSIALLLAAGPISTGPTLSAVGPRERCPVPPNDQLWVPGGTARFGSDQAYADEGPSYTARVRGFWIDRHEVTNAQYAAFVHATGHVTRAEKDGGSAVFDPPGPLDRPTSPDQWWRYVKGANWRHPEGPGSGLRGRDRWPVVHIAYDDALAYAQWTGRSLPNEEQFEYAARAGGAESLDQPPPDAANSWQGTFPISNDGTDGHSRLAPVGCYKANAYGLNDMIGNVWEWTGSWYQPGHQPMRAGWGTPGNPSFDPSQPDARTRVIKGGSFLCAPNYCARYRPSARHGQDETLGASHLGFRTVSLK